LELATPTIWSPKARLEGESVGAVAALVAPVPLKLTVCGLPLALSLMVTAPFAVPLDCGVNATLMVQLAPPASEAGQLVVSAKG